MSHRVFTAADRRVFTRACELMGGPPERRLIERLGRNLLGEPGCGPDPACLGAAGRRELSWFAGRGHVSIDRLAPGLFDRRGARALRSLQAVLFFPGLGNLDLSRRAGLHRLGRALCDLGPGEVENRIEHFPESWKECLRNVRRMLAEQPEALQTAAGLREEFSIEDSEVRQ